MLATVKWYVIESPGAIEAGDSTEGGTARLGLWPPKSISPFQSPEVLKTGNMKFLLTTLVLTVLTTLALAYASPVAMFPVPSSVNVSLLPVSAQTLTSVLTIAWLAEEAMKFAEL